MKVLPIFALWLVALSRCATADSTVTNDTEAAEWHRIYQRLEHRMEQVGITNDEQGLLQSLKSGLLQHVIVHPSFGISWDEVPPPTLTNASALAAVNAFIATNGWNMHTGRLWFSYGSIDPKPICGLPWEAIRSRGFPALTHQGVLYVILKGWHHNVSGVAYNPNTNLFTGVAGFKPLAGHWYAWADPEDNIKLPQIYEGSRVLQQSAPAGGSQPVHAGTNQAPAAAGIHR